MSNSKFQLSRMTILIAYLLIDCSASCDESTQAWSCFLFVPSRMCSVSVCAESNSTSVFQFISFSDF
jgi:hypothetical protein